MSKPVPDADLAAMRAVARQSLVDTCVVRTPGTPTYGDDNSPIPGVPTDATLDCRVTGKGGGERVFAAAVVIEAERLLVLPWDAAISPACIVAWQGKVWQVLATNGDNTYRLSTLALIKGRT